MLLLKVDGIACRSSGRTVVDQLSCHVHVGEIANLLGPNGCGKTMILRTQSKREPSAIVGRMLEYADADSLGRLGPNADGPISTVVTEKAFKGAETPYTLRLETGTRLLSLFPIHRDFGKGERVRARVTADHLAGFGCHALREVRHRNSLRQQPWTSAAPSEKIRRLPKD